MKNDLTLNRYAMYDANKMEMNCKNPAGMLSSTDVSEEKPINEFRMMEPKTEVTEAPALTATIIMAKSQYFGSHHASRTCLKLNLCDTIPC